MNLGSVRVSLQDLDGDGRLDLVTRRFIYPTSYSTFAERGNGSGRFGGSIPLPDSSVGKFLLLADFDGDGVADAVAWDGATLRLLRNRGGGTFEPSFQLDYAADRFVAGDFDGDGRNDLAVSDFDPVNGRGVSLFLGDGHGGLRRSHRVAVDSNDLVAADADGDGRTDLYVGGLLYLSREAAFSTTRLVPVVVSAPGAFGSSYVTELWLTNRSTAKVDVTLEYTASTGGGSGVGSTTLAPGEVRAARDAIGYLRTLGVPIEEGGSRAGTLRVRFTGAVTSLDVSARARVTTPAGAGRVGVAYEGLPPWRLLDGESVIPWLEETADDRTNLALVNGGEPDEGPITLRVTVVAGPPGAVRNAVIGDVVLAPGQLYQIDRVLLASGTGAPRGIARIRRIAGTARYDAFAIVNSNRSSDGSFLRAQPLGASALHEVPVVVESTSFSTELVLTNTSATFPLLVYVDLAGDSIATANHRTGTQLTMGPGETRRIPELVEELRRLGVPGIGPKGPTFVASLTSGGDDVIVGARVAGRGTAAGTGVSIEGAAYVSSGSLWVDGLTQDERTRTNLVIQARLPATCRVELYDGESGRIAATIPDLALGRDGRLQLDEVLARHAPAVRSGYARVSAKDGYFTAYAVLNDGAHPGEGTGDGSFVAGEPDPER